MELKISHGLNLFGGQGVSPSHGRELFHFST